ncbi:MAG: metal-dependent hydrolase [Deltaproteobacteria bacterium]|nr:metal-dependent hydrolase [Deltaproteobacteria bacterium]
MDLRGAKITWLGHSTVLVTTPEGKKVLVDPWLATNPKCPAAYHGLVPDGVLVTHGHNDHVGELLSMHGRCEGPIVGIYDLTSWLARKGVAESKLVGMNKGGTVELAQLKIAVSMTDAKHSSTYTEADGTMVPLGEPAGYVIRLSNDLRIYVSGDTCCFGDMAIIAELWRPELAILPIGDHFTMDPKGAALACKLLKVKAVMPYHYGTFPMLTGTPAALRAALREGNILPESAVLAVEPGQSVG